MVDFIDKNMRTILLTLCLFFSTILCAQNKFLMEIEKANAVYNSITGTFTRTQVNAAKGTSVKTEGDLYVAGEEQMAQHYKAPSTDLLIINGNEFYMVRGKKTNKFNTEKKPLKEIHKYVEKNFNFSVDNIIKELDLQKPIYYNLAAYGHFGRKDLNLTWEQIKE